MDSTGQEQGIVKREGTGPGESRESSEIQKQIIEEVFERLNDPHAITLVYPNADASQVIRGEVDPDYENGSTIRFLMLDNSRGLTRDEICVAILDNRSTINSKSFGSKVPMLTQEVESTREISIARFVQSAGDRLKKQGVYYKLNLSDTTHEHSFLATYAVKGKSYHYRIKPDIPRFAEHWESGNAQLADVGLYYMGDNEDVTQLDFQDILTAMRRAKPSEKLTRKVSEHEKEYQLAELEKAGQEQKALERFQSQTNSR